MNKNKAKTSLWGNEASLEKEGASRRIFSNVSVSAAAAVVGFTLAGASSTALANPVDLQFTYGNGTVTNNGVDTFVTTFDKVTRADAVNGFNVEANTSFLVDQLQGSGSVFYVTDNTGALSNVDGHIGSNGTVIISNAHGVRFGVGSTVDVEGCLLYTSPSPRDKTVSRMPSSA